MDSFWKVNRNKNQVIINPINKVTGELDAPPSKSYTHRVFFAGLLSDGKTTIENPLKCKDTLASLKSVRNFGATADWYKVENDGVIEPAVINANESGTTARLSIAVASLADGESRIDGRTGLRNRPMGPLLDSLNHLNIEIESNKGKLPVIIEGGDLRSREVNISGEISSQFITALLFLGAKVGLKIKVVDGFVSKPYVDMTVEVLRKARVNIKRKKNVFNVNKGIKPVDFMVPGDYSSASFLLAAGTLFGDVEINNLKKDSVQADREIIDLLKRFGARVTVKNNKVEVQKDELQGLKIDCSQYPDLFPILTVLGAFSEGKTIITGKQLRYKETDRIENMVKNLKNMDAEIKELENGVEIKKNVLKGAVLDPRGDHRIAMALSIAALGAKGRSTIKNYKCVGKSYPNFFDDLSEVVEDGS